MKIVGLTGGIASGKSAVARLVRERGIPIIDADEVARAIVAPGEPALEMLRNTFGDSVFQSDGALDRSALGALIFHNPEERKKLEAITHPLIARETAKRLQALAGKGHRMAFYEAALLIETGRVDMVDTLVLVATSPEIQMERLIRRESLSEVDAQARLTAQMPLDEKRRHADFIIENNGGLDELADRVDELIESLLAQSSG